MSTIDLGTATTAAELVNAARTASEGGKRLLIEKDGDTNEAGEARYRLSAESQFSRFIRNVKAFVTGGTSGYDHDYRVQLALKHLVDKEADRLDAVPFWQQQVDGLSDNIRQVNGKSISGNAAALFVKLVDSAKLTVVFPRDVSALNSDSSRQDHDYDEIPEVRFPGYETASDWFVASPDLDPPIDHSPHDYDYIPSQHQTRDESYQILNATGQNDIDDHMVQSPIVPRVPNRASMYEVPVSRNTASVINALSLLPRDPEAETVPKIGRTQLRETRLSQAAVETIKTIPALQAKSDADFRSSLLFTERAGNGPLSENDPAKPEGILLASLANTVKLNDFKKLSIAIDRKEFNEKLNLALAQENNSEVGRTDLALVGSKAADLLVAAKVLDEVLHDLENSALVARENNGREDEHYRLRFADLQTQLDGGARVEPDDDFTPLDQDSREPDEVYTALTPREPLDVDSSEEGIYAHLSEISTEKLGSAEET